MEDLVFRPMTPEEMEFLAASQQRRLSPLTGGAFLQRGLPDPMLQTAGGLQSLDEKAAGLPRRPGVPSVRLQTKPLPPGFKQDFNAFGLNAKLNLAEVLKTRGLLGLIRPQELHGNFNQSRFNLTGPEGQQFVKDRRTGFGVGGTVRLPGGVNVSGDFSQGGPESNKTTSFSGGLKVPFGDRGMLSLTGGMTRHGDTFNRRGKTSKRVGVVGSLNF